MQNLTDLEQKIVSVMITAICHPERSSGYIDDEFRSLAKAQGITSKAISGVVSSLVQKGIVSTMEDEIENDAGRYVKCQYYSFKEVPAKELVEVAKELNGGTLWIEHSNLGV